MVKEKKFLKFLFLGQSFGLCEQISVLLKEKENYNLISVTNKEGFEQVLLENENIEIIIINWNFLGQKTFACIEFVLKKIGYTANIIISAENLTIKEIVKLFRAGVKGYINLPVVDSDIKKQINFVLKSPFNTKEYEFIEKYNKIKNLIGNNENKEALYLIEEAFNLFECFESYLNKAYLKSIDGHFYQALIYFRRAILVSYYQEKLYNNKKIIYDKLGDLVNFNEVITMIDSIKYSREIDFETEDIFNCVLDIKPSTTNIYNCLGLYYKKINEYEKSILAYGKSLKLNFNDENVFFNMAKVYFLMNNKEKAKEYLSIAIMKKNDFNEAINFLKEIE